MIIARLCTKSTVAAELCTPSLVSHLVRLLQLNLVEELEQETEGGGGGRGGDPMSGTAQQHAMMVLSNQCVCEALTRMAEADLPASRERVAGTVTMLHAIDEIVALTHLPRVGNKQTANNARLEYCY